MVTAVDTIADDNGTGFDVEVAMQADCSPALQSFADPVQQTAVQTYLNDATPSATPNSSSFGQSSFSTSAASSVPRCNEDRHFGPSSGPNRKPIKCASNPVSRSNDSGY